jgi:hypothetical protein
LSSSTDKPQVQQLFSARLETVDEYEEVRSMYRQTRPRINKVYSLEIQSARQGWESRGATMSNQKKVWHGTNPANLLSILRNGLIIPKSFTHGRVYGDGVYFAESAQISLGYASEVDNKQLMLVSHVALGNYRRNGKVKSSDDSLYVGGNGYIIIPRTNQINPIYLVEFV